jgi:lipopolysaccharide export LptBFGC system permease protein LptF
MRQTLVPSLLALAVITFVGIGNELRERTRELPLEYVTAGDLVQLGLLFLPALVAYVVPITFMFGILMAFGRLSHQNELIAMTTAGVSLRRTVAPVLVLGAVLSVFCFAVQDRVQPWAVQRVQELLLTRLPLRVTLEALTPGVMHDFRGWRVYHTGRDPETGRLQELKILTPESGGRATIYYAEEAEVVSTAEGKALRMYNGHVILPQEGGRVGRITFSSQVLSLPPFATAAPAKTWWAAPLERLLAVESELDEKVAKGGTSRDRDSLRRVRQEISDRLALSLACLAVGCVAAPLGARARGGGRSFTFSAGLGVFLVYYLLWMTLQPRSLGSLAEVVARGMAPNLLLGAVGVWLMWRLDRV